MFSTYNITDPTPLEQIWADQPLVLFALVLLSLFIILSGACSVCCFGNYKLNFEF